MIRRLGSTYICVLVALALQVACADEICVAGQDFCSTTNLLGNVKKAQYHWPHQKGNANRTGFSPYVVRRDLKNGPTWRSQDPHGAVIRSTPLIDEQRNIYLATVPGNIYKFTPSGTILWEYKSSWGPLPAVPSIMDGSIFCNSQQGIVFALDMQTGEERWFTKVSPNGTHGDTASLLAVEGIVVSATDDAGLGNLRIVALESVRGTILWSYELSVAVYNFQASSPGDGTIIFMTSDGGLYRLQLRTGKLIWFSGVRDPKKYFFSTGAAVVGPNGIVYCASNTDEGGLIHAYQLWNGDQLWSRNVGLLANQAVAVGNIAGHGMAITVGIGENPGLPLSLCLGFVGVPLFCTSVVCWSLPSCMCGSCIRRWRCISVMLALFPSICLGLWWYSKLQSGELSMVPLLTPAIANSVKFTWALLLCLRLVLTRPWFKGFAPSLSYRLVVRPLQLFVLAILALVVALGLRLLCLHWGSNPAWLWHSKVLDAELLALDANTGESLWTFSPPSFDLLAAAGDEEHLLKRLWAGHLSSLICLPDSWSQNSIGGDGTVYAGFENGRVYTVWDADGDGRINSQTEVSEYDVGHAFQASQGLAPGLLAVVPCGGGLYVWLSDDV